MVGSLPKGCALWKVGRRSFQVEHQLSAFERDVTYTDDRMAVVNRTFSNSASAVDPNAGADER